MTAARCPRCGAAFDCGAGGAEPCACGGIALATVTLATLRERFSGCLCLACLRALAAGMPVGGTDTGRGMDAGPEA